MKRSGNEIDRLISLAWAAYPLAALLIIAPLMDFLTSILPFRPSAESWRFGAYGLLGTALLTPVMGGWLAIIAAALLGHRKVQWLLVVVAGVLSLGLVPVTVLAMLDYVQLRSSVVPEAKFAFDVSAMKVFVIYGLGFLVMVTAARTGFRMLKRIPTKKGGGDPLLVPSLERQDGGAS